MAWTGPVPRWVILCALSDPLNLFLQALLTLPLPEEIKKEIGQAKRVRTRSVTREEGWVSCK